MHPPGFWPRTGSARKDRVRRNAILRGRGEWEREERGRRGAGGQNADQEERRGGGERRGMERGTYQDGKGDETWGSSSRAIADGRRRDAMEMETRERDLEEGREDRVATGRSSLLCDANGALDQLHRLSLYH